MARVLAPPQAETLFDFGPDGQMFVPDDVATGEFQPPVGTIALDEHDPEECRQESQFDRALRVVVPGGVDNSVRATHLIEVLNAISLSNSDQGFSRANRSAGYRQRTVDFAQHEGRAGDIAAALDFRSLSGREQARRLFFAAAGVGRLAVAGQETPLSAEERIVRRGIGERWAGFERRYGRTGPEARAAREAYKQELAALAIQESRH